MTKLIGKIESDEVDISVTILGAGPKGEPFVYEDFTPEQLAGLKGEKGDPGKDGYTPVKGVDYFTEADKAEIVASVLAEIPVVGSEEY